MTSLPTSAVVGVLFAVGVGQPVIYTNNIVPSLHAMHHAEVYRKSQ
jgi:hypothetical protein